MGVVVRAKIQTVEDMYRLIREAVTARQPVSLIYEQLPRLICLHRLGRNSASRPRLLCYQYGGESSTGLEATGSPANWRCMKLEKFSRVELIEGAWHSAKPFPAANPHNRSGCGGRRLPGAHSTNGAMREAGG
jgi:hypothetical protein